MAQEMGADQAAEVAEPAGVSIEEAARRLDVEQSTIRAWIKAGKLRATRESVPDGPGPGWRYRVHLDEALREGTLVRRPRARSGSPVPTAAERAAEQALREEFDRHRRTLTALLRVARPRGRSLEQAAPAAAPDQAVIDELERHERALRTLLARQQRLADEQRARIAELERGVTAVGAKLAELAQRRPGRPRRSPPGEAPPE